MMHFFETVVLDNEQELTGEFLVLPRRFLPEGAVADGPDVLARTIGFAELRPIAPGWLVHAVALMAANEGTAFVQSWGPQELSDIHATQPQNRHYRFAEHVTMARILPFENSPLTGESLGEIITRASGVGLGAFVGFAVAGESAAVFVLVPAGMILFGTSAGLARGLEEGIRERVKRLIVGKRV